MDKSMETGNNLVYLGSCKQFTVGGGNGNPLQYSCLGNPTTEESGGLQPWGRRESDTTERCAQIVHCGQIGGTKEASADDAGEAGEVGILEGFEI